MSGGRARRLVGATVVLAMTAGLTMGSGSSQAASTGQRDPERGPLIAGAHSYVRGRYVWTDYAYDDTGPNSNGLDGGDAAYPARPYPGNTADLVQVQVGTADRRAPVRLDVVLSTLTDGGDAVVGVGFDTDRDPATGAATVPGGGWTVSRSLGLEHLALLDTRDGSGTLLSWNGTELAPAGTFAVSVDRSRNAVSATVPQLVPRRARWRAVSLAGMADDAGSWVDGAHEIYDLGFVRGEDPVDEIVLAVREQVPQLGFVPLQDKTQADVLAGELPPHLAVAEVRFGTRATDRAEPVAGWNTFLYHSRVDLTEWGEGVDDQGASIEYFGVYQPYGVLIPEKWLPDPERPPSPMVILMHGANQYQTVNRVHFSERGLVIPGAYDVDGIVIFPNGRTTGWGTDLAERDALDSMDDAIARLGIDEDRVVLSGISSGGMGTYRIAARWPDRFAGGFSIVGGGTEQLENLTNVPFRAANGAADPLVSLPIWRGSADALAAAGTVDYRITLVHNRSHDGPIAEGNCYYLDLLDRPRDLDPQRVRYTTVPADYAPEMGLVPDGAYWVSSMVSRDGAPASVDAASGMQQPRVVADDWAGPTAARVDQNMTQTADFCGPHPTLRGMNDWSTEGRAFAVDEAASLTNHLDVVVANLSSARLDMVRAGLDTELAPGESLTVAVAGDGPTTLALAGDWPAQVTVDGEPVTATDGVLELTGDFGGEPTEVAITG